MKFCQLFLGNDGKQMKMADKKKGFFVKKREEISVEGEKAEVIDR